MAKKLPNGNWSLGHKEITDAQLDKIIRDMCAGTDLEQFGPPPYLAHRMPDGEDYAGAAPEAQNTQFPRANGAGIGPQAAVLIFLIPAVLLAWPIGKLIVSAIVR